MQLVKNATGSERRSLVKIRILSLASGKRSDHDQFTSDVVLEASVRPSGTLKHSVLGQDWILRSGVDLNCRHVQSTCKMKNR